MSVPPAPAGKLSFRAVRKLASGATAEVYLAIDMKTEFVDGVANAEECS